MNLDYLRSNAGDIASLFGWHALLSVVPLVLGLLLALPLGWLARARPRLYPVMIGATGLLYTIPSLALFVALPIVLGTRILDPLNVVVALTIYTVALLVRTVADGLAAVPEDVRLSATAMGFRPARLFWRVELPVAVPVIASGLRVASVSNVSLVSVAALIGIPQLGQLFTDGFNRAFYTPLVVGIVLCVVLALTLDGLILLGRRLLTPWDRSVQAA